MIDLFICRIKDVNEECPLLVRDVASGLITIVDEMDPMVVSKEPLTIMKDLLLVVQEL